MSKRIRRGKGDWQLLMLLLDFPQGASLKQMFPDRPTAPAVMVDSIHRMWGEGMVDRMVKSGTVFYALTEEGRKQATDAKHNLESPDVKGSCSVCS